MSTETEIIAAENYFFKALARRDLRGLVTTLGEDFLLVDVMTGSEIPRAALVESVDSGRLIFDSIERLDARVRVYGNAAIVTGRTRMRGRFDARPFQVHSRYTHVYAGARDGWRLVSAQGTPIAETGAGEVDTRGIGGMVEPLGRPA